MMIGPVLPASANPRMSVAPAPAPTQPRHLDHWDEGGRRGLNHIADGEVVSVGATTMHPLMWGIPGYRFAGGQATAHAGVEILSEDGGAAAADNFAKVSSLMDAAPVKAVAELGQVVIEARQDDAYDKYFERAYHIPGFQAVAASGGGLSTYFGGHVHADGVFFHELGHIAGDLVDEGAWGKAITDDDANLRAILAKGTLTPTQLGPVETDPVRRARWTPTLAPGGVTPYAQDALQSGTRVEDIAEALRLRTLERYDNGLMATFTDKATGAARPIGFAELYPHRAALLGTLGPALADVTHAS
jgi:hypothetical protein